MSEEASIGWEQIRQRFEGLQAKLAQGSTRSPDEQKRILKQRAHDLAREPETTVDTRDLLEVVEFELAGERYGFELGCVRTVCVLQDLTPVPCTPAFVLGIINLRGEIHTVIDLKKFFDLPDAGITELNKIILIQHDHLQLGILADAIRGVRRIILAELQPTLATLTDIRADYLRGITSDRLVVLNPVKILSDKRLLVDEEVSP